MHHAGTHTVRLGRVVFILGLLLAVSLALGAPPGGQGGGHGGGGEEPPPDPAVVYIESGELMIMNADGSNQTPVAGLSAEYASWSPDGMQIIFTATINGIAGVYITNLDGTGLELIVDLVESFHVLHKPLWSPVPAPDGQERILFIDEDPGGSSWDIFLVNVDGTGVVNLTNTPDLSESWASWSPDSDRIVAMTLDPFSGANRGLHVYDLALTESGLAVVDITMLGTEQGSPIEPSNDPGFPDWARTQSRIVVSAWAEGDNNKELWVIDPDELAPPVRLMDTPHHDTLPTWLPDDSAIAFRQNADRPKHDGLFVVSSDGSGVIQSLGAKRGTRPDWWRGP